MLLGQEVERVEAVAGARAAAARTAAAAAAAAAAACLLVPVHVTAVLSAAGPALM